MTLTALLLAGGRSRRMGRDKATICLAGRPLWQRQLALLNELRPAALWISAVTVPPWCPAGIDVVEDRTPLRGPLSGIAAGLQRMQTSHLLVLAIDLPQMTAAHLRTLEETTSPGVGVVPWQGDYYEPLCAIYPAEAASVAADALNRSDASLQTFAQTLFLQNRIRVRPVAAAEEPLYLNVNTPSQIPAHA